MVFSIGDGYQSYFLTAAACAARKAAATAEAVFILDD